MLRTVCLACAATLSVVAASGATGSATVEADPQVDWARSAGTHLSGVTGASDAAGVVAGSRAPIDDSTWLVRKYSANGTVSWTVRWSPTDARAAASDVDVHPDGPIYAVGAVGTLGEYDGGSEWMVRSYRRGGSLRWTVRGGSHCAWTGATGVAVQRAGQVFVTGHCDRDGATKSAWIRKFDPTGQQLWRRWLPTPTGATRWVGTSDLDLAQKNFPYVIGTVARPTDTPGVFDLDAAVYTYDKDAGPRVKILPEGSTEGADIGVGLDASKGNAVGVVREVGATQPAMVLRIKGFDKGDLTIGWRTWLSIDPGAVVIRRVGALPTSLVGGDGAVVGLSRKGSVQYLLAVDGFVRALARGSRSDQIWAAGDDGVRGQLWRLLGMDTPQSRDPEAPVTRLPD
jgi:hypothetical protein